MEDKRTKIELEIWEAQQFLIFRKYYQQFTKLQNHNVFEKEFTGKVVLDIKDGVVRNLQKISFYHY